MFAPLVCFLVYMLVSVSVTALIWGFIAAGGGRRADVVTVFWSVRAWWVSPAMLMRSRFNVLQTSNIILLENPLLTEMTKQSFYIYHLSSLTSASHYLTFTISSALLNVPCSKFLSLSLLRQIFSIVFVIFKPHLHFLLTLPCCSIVPIFFVNL